MKFISSLVIAYGLLLWIGGTIGYVKAQSTISLVMGSVSAALLVVGGLLMWRDAALGYWGALAVTSLVTVLFCYRYFITQKFMPAGMMAILSGVVLIALLAVIKTWLKAK